MNADISRIKHDYGVEGTGAVDVGVLAGKHIGVASGNRSLAALVAHFLRRQLAKGSVRVGDWEKTPLSIEQVSFIITLVLKCCDNSSCLAAAEIGVFLLFTP